MVPPKLISKIYIKQPIMLSLEIVYKILFANQIEGGVKWELGGEGNLLLDMLHT